MPSELEACLDYLLNCPLPQFNLLTVNRFLAYTNEREVELAESELEFLEREGVVVPALRLKRTKDGKGRYNAVFTDSYSLQGAFKTGAASLPAPGDYTPWKGYVDGPSPRVLVFYHPYQVIVIRQFVNLMRFGFPAGWHLQSIEPVKLLEEMTSNTKAAIAAIRASMPTWNKRIGLLMLLEQAYKPQVTGQFSSSVFETDAYAKWCGWRKREYSPKKSLEVSGLSIDEVNNLFNWISVQASAIDPLRNWYVLVRIISRQQLRGLKGRALLAQEYYDIARMLGLFIKDLKGGDIPEPDDVADGRRGSWKPILFGSPFDYTQEETRKAILDHYLQTPTLRYMLLYEGATEETAIQLILEALDFSPDKQGVLLFNYEGTGGIVSGRIARMLQMAASQGIEVFVTSDDDEGAKDNIMELENQKLLKPGMSHVWKGDFEGENFGLESVLAVINDKIGNLPGLLKLDRGEVEKEMSKGKVLMRSIRDVCYVKNRTKLEDIISKKELAVILMAPRISQIRDEYAGSRWKPKFPIEQVLLETLSSFKLKV